MTTPMESTSTTPQRMHLSLNVRDLPRSIAFYAALLEREPVKVRPGYAKFTLDDPGLVLSLNGSASGLPERQGAPGSGALSHLGFQVPDDAGLERRRRSLEEAGLEIALDEPGVSCCYAVQNKFWVVDPDGNPWEFYRFVADDDGGSAARRPAGEAAAAGAAAQAGCCVPGATACSPQRA